MSLKTFHLVFIIISILLALGFAAWNLMNYYSPAGVTRDLGWGIGAAVTAVGLVVYEVYFLKKTKNVSYL